jgi:hypothetical protein
MAVMMPPNMPALPSKRAATADAGAGTVTLANICARPRLGAGAGLVIGERRIGGDRKARAPAVEQMEGAWKRESYGAARSKRSLACQSVPYVPDSAHDGPQEMGCKRELCSLSGQTPNVGLKRPAVGRSA